jgi:hypothetical protein
MRLRDIEKLVKQHLVPGGGGGIGGGITYDWSRTDPLSGDPLIELPVWELPEYDLNNDTFETTGILDLSAMPEWPGACLAKILQAPLAADQLTEFYLSPVDVDYILGVLHFEGPTDLSGYGTILVPEGTRLRCQSNGNGAAGPPPYFTVLCLPLG